MDKSLTEFHIDIIEAFKKLQSAIDVFSEAIRKDTTLVCELYEDQFDWSNDREGLIRLVKTIEYTDNLEARETLKQVGAVGCSEDTLKAVISLNNAKVAFKAAIQALKNANKDVKMKILMQKLDGFFDDKLSGWSDVVKGAIRRTGHARLNLKHCYRTLHYVEFHPKRVSWGWDSKARSLKKISLAQAEKMLLEKGGDSGIDFQLRKLATLSPGTPLAVVQELTPALNVNIIPFEDEKELSIKSVRTALPVFYLCDNAKPSVIVKPPLKEPHAKDASRRDKVIEEECFLPAIRAHLYKHA